MSTEQEISDYIILSARVEESIDVIEKLLGEKEKIIHKYKILPAIKVRAFRSTIEKIAKLYPDLHIEESKNYHALLKSYHSNYPPFEKS